MTKTAVRSAMRPRGAIAAFVIACAIAVQACGARTELHAPEEEGEGGSSSASTVTGMERVCGPNCTVGHACCVGGCDGPAAITVNDCCVCFPNEVNSWECPDAQCGD